MGKITILTLFGATVLRKHWHRSRPRPCKQKRRTFSRAEPNPSAVGALCRCRRCFQSFSRGPSKFSLRKRSGTRPPGHGSAPTTRTRTRRASSPYPHCEAGGRRFSTSFRFTAPSPPTAPHPIPSQERLQSLSPVRPPRGRATSPSASQVLLLLLFNLLTPLLGSRPLLNADGSAHHICTNPKPSRLFSPESCYLRAEPPTSPPRPRIS
jgi:hypothetical protein